MYSDTVITLDRLDSFADDNRLVQAQVLALLREKSAADNQYLPLLAVVFAIALPIILGLSPIDPMTTEEPWIRGIALAVSAAIIVLPLSAAIAIPVVLNQMKANRALVWLGAFEAELDRRRSQTGRAARRWQAAH